MHDPAFVASLLGALAAGDSELAQVLQQLELALTRHVGAGHEDRGPWRRGAHARDAAQPRGGVPLERAPQPQHEQRAWGDLQRVKAHPLLAAVALGCVSLAAPRGRLHAPELLAAQRLRRAGDRCLQVTRRLEHLVDPPLALLEQLGLRTRAVQRNQHRAPRREEPQQLVQLSDDRAQHFLLLRTAAAGLMHDAVEVEQDVVVGRAAPVYRAHHTGEARVDPCV